MVKAGSILMMAKTWSLILVLSRILKFLEIVNFQFLHSWTETKKNYFQFLFVWKLNLDFVEFYGLKYNFQAWFVKEIYLCRVLPGKEILQIHNFSPGVLFYMKRKWGILIAKHFPSIRCHILDIATIITWKISCLYF